MAMEIQAFNDNEDLCFRTNPGEFIYQRFLAYVDGSPLHEFFLQLDQDFMMSLSDQATLLARISEEIETYKERLRSLPPVDLPRDHLTAVTIKDEQFFLYPLSDVHRELMQLGRLFTDISETLEQKSVLRVFIVPTLTSIQFRLLTILKRTGGIERRDLEAALVKDYQRLIQSEIVTAELRAEFERDVFSLKEGPVIEESLQTLIASRLIEPDVEESLTPTQKLLLVRI
jgi:hypothetical protein